jgi:hypothetical protein
MNRELLAKRFGILYPKSGCDSWHHYHHPIFQDLIEHNQQVDSTLVESILTEATQQGISRILLSSEMLSRSTVTIEHLKEIRRSFGKHQITIVVYLRRQDGFLQSTYAERVKRGLLAVPATIQNIETELDYYRFIQKYATVFGAGSIKIRSFERAIAVGIYNDFLQVLGLSLDSEFRLPEKNVNTRWPWLYIELLRVANATKLTRKLMMNRWILATAIRLNRLFPTIMDNPKPLSLKAKKLINERYIESNNKLAREFLDENELF